MQRARSSMETTGAPVQTRLRQVVNFDDGVTDGAVRAADNGSVSAGRQTRDNGRFLGVAGRNSSLFDLSFLRGLPVVVRSDGGAIAIVELEGWIGECRRHLP